MLFDPPSPQIAKTTLWASPPKRAFFDQVLSRPAFWGKSYEGFFPGKSILYNLLPQNICFEKETFIALAPEDRPRKYIVKRCVLVGWGGGYVQTAVFAL